MKYSSYLRYWLIMIVGQMFSMSFIVVSENISNLFWYCHIGWFATYTCFIFGCMIYKVSKYKKENHG